MINAIMRKEWLKLRLILIGILFMSISLLVNFWFNLSFAFSTVEPETMMWYKFVNFQEKPYDYFAYVFYLNALAIALFQFVPERIKNRIKIMVHLPISMKKSLFFHFLVGLFFIFLMSAIITIAIIFILYIYFIPEIIYIGFNDLFFYFLASFLIYLGISSVIIETKPIYSGIKFILTLFVVFLFHKNIFTLVDFLWIIFIPFMFFIALDSFYSVKGQRFKSKLSTSLYLVCALFMLISSYMIYTNKYKFEFNKYYIFYSSIVKDFVYQKNFGKHQFEYGIKDKKTFNRDEYESYLPFVYWRNLDIQGKLPIKIDNEIFDKKTIKKSRLSFAYNPNYLKKNEIELYPLFNPNSKVSMIKFPEEMIYFGKNSIDIYNYDNKLDKKLSDELKKLIDEKKVSFPIKNIWGKATNLKPYDLGYFFLDSKDRLFRLNRRDDKIKLNHIIYPKNISIAYMNISENKQKKYAGLMISKDSVVYLIDYNNFTFKKLALDNFDYKNMKLQFIANPKYYLIRYTDGKTYYVTVFDKKLKQLDKNRFK